MANIASHGAEAARSLSRIQSIGRNCEFGYIQKHFGVEVPASLLRWAGCELPNLVGAIEDRFERLGDRMSPKPLGPASRRWRYWLTDETYDLTFHTSMEISRHSPDEAHTRMRPVWRRLAEKQIESFRSPDLLFIYSDKSMTAPSDALPLASTLRRFGRTWLLVVTEGVPKATLVRDGLIAGQVPFLTNPSGAASYKADGWLEMANAAFDIWQRETMKSA